MENQAKILIAVAMFTFSAAMYAQTGNMGVNTSTPMTSLDVSGKTDGSGNLLTTDITGLQAPRLTRLDLTAKGNSLYGADQQGALIYITDVSGGDSLSQRVNVTSVGYYYFDGVQWMKMGLTGGSGLLPAGTISAYGGSTQPTGWLFCDGSEVSRTTYAELFATIGTTYGAGDGSTTFNLPNANGVFLRGAGSQNIGGTTYTASAQGTSQGDATKFPNNPFVTNPIGHHEHYYNVPSFSTVNVGGGGMGVSVWNGGYYTYQSTYGGSTAHNHSISGGDSETHPANITVTYIIKY